MNKKANIKLIDEINKVLIAFSDENKISMIINKKNIAIGISNIKFKFSKDIIHVVFYQEYKSTGYQQKSKKTLIFEFQSNDWKIIEEFSG